MRVLGAERDRYLSLGHRQFGVLSDGDLGFPDTAVNEPVGAEFLDRTDLEPDTAAAVANPRAFGTQAPGSPAPCAPPVAAGPGR